MHPTNDAFINAQLCTQSFETAEVDAKYSKVNFT